MKDFSHIFVITKGTLHGGATRFVINYSIFILRRGIGIPLIIVGSDDGKSLASYCEDNGIACRILPELSNSVNMLHDIRCILHLVRLFRRLQPQAKVFLNSSKAGFVGRLASVISGFTVNYVVHGWSYAGWKQYSRGTIYFLFELVIFIFSFRSCRIFCVSEFDRRSSPFRFFPWLTFPGLFVIHNGVSEIAVPLPPASSDITASLPRRNLRLVTVCRLDEQKDVSSLLNAISLLDGIELDIYGDGPQNHSLQALSLALGVSRVVAFKGVVSSERLRCDLSTYDVFILVSRWEGFPLSTLEAMSVGLPVIVSDVGGAAEVFSVCGQSQFGFAIPPLNNPRQIADRIQIYKDPVILRIHSLFARTVYKNFFTDELCYNAYEGLSVALS